MAPNIRTFPVAALATTLAGCASTDPRAVRADGQASARPVPAPAVAVPATPPAGQPVSPEESARRTEARRRALREQAQNMLQQDNPQ